MASTTVSVVVVLSAIGRCRTSARIKAVAPTGRCARAGDLAFCPAFCSDARWIFLTIRWFCSKHVFDWLMLARCVICLEFHIF